MIAAGQTALQCSRQPGGRELRAGGAEQPARAVQQHRCEPRRLPAEKWLMASMTGLSILSAKTSTAAPDAIGSPLPAELLVPAMFDGQIAVVGRDEQAATLAPRSPPRHRHGWRWKRGHAIANCGVAIPPAHGGKRQHGGHGVGRVFEESLASTCLEPDFGLELVPEMDRLPTANGGLVQSVGIGCGHLRMNRNRSHRLHRSGKAQILAEPEHGLHAGIAARRKIDAGQQLPAVGGRLFDRGGDALAALAEYACLPGGHQAGLQPAMRPGTVGDDHQRTVLQPAQQRAIGGRTQRPRPVVLLRIAGARFGRQPLHHLVQGIQGQVDNGVGADANVFPERGQKPCAHRLDRIPAGHAPKDNDKAAV